MKFLLALMAYWEQICDDCAGLASCVYTDTMLCSHFQPATSSPSCVPHGLGIVGLLNLLSLKITVSCPDLLSDLSFTVKLTFVSFQMLKALNQSTQRDTLKRRVPALLQQHSCEREEGAEEEWRLLHVHNRMCQIRATRPSISFLHWYKRCGIAVLSDSASKMLAV